MIDLQWVYFFYGLAFWVMGVLIFLMPKGKDLLNLSRDLRLIGGFGLLHGINEWVDLLIFRGGPLDVETLKIAGALLLPISFSFLVAFGVRIFFRNSPYLKYLWAFCLAVWASVYFYSSDFLISGIAARYFICIPGTFLTAAGLLLTLLKANKTLPRIVLWSVLSTAVIFSVYGILSGLIVPQAPFLTASFINYPNFNAVTGFPVQFFRMICAILLAIGFWGISGIYSLEMKKIRLRGGVKGKITAIIFLLAGSAVVLMFTITFIWLHGLMICTIEDHQMQMTRLLAQSVKQFLSNEVEQLTVHVRSPVWKGYVEQSNLKYRSMPSGTIDRMLQEMDREWVSGKSGNDWVEKILSNPMSARLAVLVSSDQEVAEIFLTDRYGGLVAASRKTTDFYQADEEWWQKTYANGRGHNRIGTYERDESSGAWSIPLSLPVRGSDGQVIGICKESLDVGVLFHVLDRFHFGKTGRAMLMDREGNLLFPREKNALDEGLLDEKGLRELTGKQTYLLWNERGKLMQGVRKVNSFVLLDYPLLLQNGIVWYIAVCQDANEVFSPLFVVQIGLSMFLMIVLSGITIAGFLVGKRFSRPIQELRVATEAIMAGNWEFENKVKTGDEIEDLSNAFCRMTAQLKAMYENLEKKVQEKTLELSMKVQELEDTKQAILNVLDDLSVEKLKLEDSEKKLKALTGDLSRSNAELEQFAYIASHDLQEPLRMVASYVQLLAQRYKGKLGTDADEFIGFAVDGALRMRMLINDLLEYSRIGTRGTPFVPVDCRVVLGWARENLKVAIEESGAQIDAGELPEIIADANQMLRLLQNLIANAIKFRKKDEALRILISAREEPGEWLFSVRDRGIGFDMKYAERIFGIFQRLHGREEYSGSGIGLAVCKKIVERHGGRIWAESEAGQGTVFYFTIPIRERNP